MSSRYLIAEQEEVTTTRFTEFDLAHDFSTFLVPIILGSIKVACKFNTFYFKHLKSIRNMHCQRVIHLMYLESAMQLATW